MSTKRHYSASPTKEEFMSHVDKHEMSVQIDSGLHRHLTFKQPNTFNRGFHIVTWPGYLAFSGDMGSFVFARLADMFEFFRGDEINPGYWAEKVQATCKTDGHRKFSGDLYVNAIKQDFDGWAFESDEQKAEAWSAIADDWDGLLRYQSEDMRSAVTAAMDWECPITKQRFADFWDHNFEDHTYRFIWCCHAIQFAIASYDAASKTGEHHG